MLRLKVTIKVRSQIKKIKTQIVKPELDVTIVKDAKGVVERVIEARGLEKETLKCRVVVDKGQGSRFKVQGWGGRPL